MNRDRKRAMDLKVSFQVGHLIFFPLLHSSISLLPTSCLSDEHLAKSFLLACYPQVPVSCSHGRLSHRKCSPRYHQRFSRSLLSFVSPNPDFVALVPVHCIPHPVYVTHQVRSIPLSLSCRAGAYHKLDRPNSNDVSMFSGDSFDSSICFKRGSVFGVVVTAIHENPVPTPSLSWVVDVLLSLLLFLGPRPFADFTHCASAESQYSIGRRSFMLIDTCNIMEQTSALSALG